MNNEPRSILFSAPALLEGRLIRLEPLRSEHIDALVEAAGGGAVFAWFPVSLHGRERMIAAARRLLNEQRQGVSMPYVTMAQSSGEVIGATSYCAMSPEHSRTEIGWTWLTPAWQRSGANREAKYLMLRQAFEEWGLRRVEFKTHHLNQASRTALARLGATEEGTFRQHMVMPDGSARDSVYFSILDSEWPAVKANLEIGLQPIG